MSGIIQVLSSNYRTRIPQYINVATATGTNNTVSLSVPSGAQPNDMLIAFSNQTSSTTTFTMTNPPGWLTALDELGRYCGYLPYWDGVTTSYSFVKSGICNPRVTILALRNAAFDLVGVQSAAAAAPVAPEIILSENQSILLACYWSLNTTTVTYTTPAGFTEVSDGSALAVSYKTPVAAGATGTVTATGSAGTNSRGVLVGIKPN